LGILLISIIIAYYYIELALILLVFDLRKELLIFEKLGLYG